MSPPSVRAIAVALVPLLGCFTSSRDRSTGDPPLDDDGGPTTTTTADAEPLGPVGCGWRRVATTVLTGALLETQPVTVGRSARIRIDAEQCPGDIPGAIRHGYSLENEFLVIDAEAWRSGPDCDAPEIVSRDVTVDFPYAATWKLGTVEIEVAAAPGGACGSDPVSACARDCDCQGGERCLSGTGDVQRCAQPCELDRECGGDGRCGDGDGLIGVCLRDVDECDADHACPPGFACDGGACTPTFALNGGTRHECGCDDDCDDGMRCVEHPATVESPVTRRCEALCLTASDVWCEGPHTCGTEASVEYDLGVCAWVGD